MNTVSLEAGHAYSFDRIFGGYPATHGNAKDLEVIDKRIYSGLKIAQRVKAFLQDQGVKVIPTVFIDETDIQSTLHRLSHGSDIGYHMLRAYGELLAQYKLAGFNYDVVYFESRFETKARDKIKEIQDATASTQSWKINTLGNKVINKREDQVIRLLGKHGDSNYPSCEVLDLCVYEDRLKTSDVVAVSVLPIEYQRQQARVRTLFSILGQTPDVINIFFDEAGIEVVPWNDNVSLVFGNTLIVD